MDEPLDTILVHSWKNELGMSQILGQVSLGEEERFHNVAIGVTGLRVSILAILRLFYVLDELEGVYERANFYGLLKQLWELLEKVLSRIFYAS